MTIQARFRLLAVGALMATVSLVGSVTAATIGYTEGTRNTVVNTIQISAPDTPSNPNAPFDLLAGGTLDAGERVNIFGRIVGAVDNYSFRIDAVSSFEISFIFGGYDFYNSGISGSTTTATKSGLTGEPADGGATGKSVAFKLLDADTSNAEIASASFESETISGNATIFTGGPGSYVFQVDGTLSNQVALYDVSISAVPLPAAGFLLFGAIGGLAMLRRRKRSA